jgi:hypothetical protein
MFVFTGTITGTITDINDNTTFPSLRQLLAALQGHRTAQESGRSEKTLHTLTPLKYKNYITLEIVKDMERCPIKGVKYGQRKS